MSENKCFCHLNGYEVKDAAARRAIDDLRAEIESGAGSGSGSAPKLYRHDLKFFGEQWSSLFEIFLTIYNTDPTNYTIEEDDDYTGYNLSTMDFLPKYTYISCTGNFGPSDDDFSTVDVSAIRIDPGLERTYVYGFERQGQVRLAYFQPDHDFCIFDGDVTEIIDDVTEVY